MKKLILLAAMLAMSLAPASPALAQTEEYSVQGYVTDISGGVVLVEEVPADEWGSAKGAFTVTGETGIFRQQGDELVPATFEDLYYGQLVVATYAGPVAESYPPQGIAGSIVIQDDPSGYDGEPAQGDAVLTTMLGALMISGGLLVRKLAP